MPRPSISARVVPDDGDLLILLRQVDGVPVLTAARECATGLPEPAPGLCSQARLGQALLDAPQGAVALRHRHTHEPALHHTRDQHNGVADLMRTAVTSGEFRADTDIDAAVDALFGSLLYLLLTGRGHAAPQRAAGLVRVLLDGVRP